MPDDAGLIAFHDLAPKQESYRDGLIAGLSLPKKAIAPKFLYDERGAALFGEITRTPEYYPTRAELEILKANAGEMAELMGPGARLIEFGASSGDKARIVLEAMESPAAYVPVDVSAEHLRHTAETMAAAFPEVDVVAVCADYTSPFPLPVELMAGKGRRVGFFPGSSIGNLTRDEAVDFLKLWRGQLGPDSGMLVGVDLQKDKHVLDRAYDDKGGVTAAFTLNLLARANREVGADFDLDAYAHEANYDETLGRVEIHLRSLKDQVVHVDGTTIEIAADERIHTEYSYKYTLKGFAALAGRAGYQASQAWIDADRLFSVHYLAAGE